MKKDPRKLIKRGGSIARAEELLKSYEEGFGDYHQKKLWRIGYVCALRDLGKLTWQQWSNLVDKERGKIE